MGLLYIISLGSLILMWLIFKGAKLDNLIRILRYTIPLQFFITIYCISYLVTFIWMLIKFYRTKRICQVHTVIFMALSLLFIGLSGQLTRSVTEVSWKMQKEMSSACDLNTNSSLLYDMNKVYNNS